MARIAAPGGVRVTGLRELNLALRNLARQMGTGGGELKAANKEVANFVASESRGKATALGSVAAKTAPSVRASAGATSASVGLGGASAPYGAGAEFGGQHRPTTMQFEPWRGSGPDAGYFLYPTIAANSARIEGEYHDALDSIIRKSGL